MDLQSGIKKKFKKQKPAIGVTILPWPRLVCNNSQIIVIMIFNFLNNLKIILKLCHHKKYGIIDINIMRF